MLGTSAARTSGRAHRRASSVLPSLLSFSHSISLPSSFPNAWKIKRRSSAPITKRARSCTGHCTRFSSGFRTNTPSPRALDIINRKFYCDRAWNLPLVFSLPLSLLSFFGWEVTKKSQRKVSHFLSGGALIKKSCSDSPRVCTCCLLFSWHFEGLRNATISMLFVCVIPF